jgi:hypothetical protein
VQKRNDFFMCTYIFLDPVLLCLQESLWVICNLLSGPPNCRMQLLSFPGSVSAASPHHIPDDGRSLLGDCNRCLFLDNILSSLQSDEFDLQQEAVFCLEQACKEPRVLHLLLSSSLYTPQQVPVSRQCARLLRVPGSSEVPPSVIRVLNALLATSGSRGSHLQQVLVQQWVDAGITEALDDIQVSH